MGCERYNNYGHGELLSWVEGNDVFLKARVYEKVVTDADSSSSEGDEPAGNAAGTVEERAVDLTAFDDVKVELVKSFGARTDIETAIDQTEDNCLVVHCPHTLESGEYALEIRLMKDGLRARSFDIQFAVVQTDCKAQTTFEVIDGCRSASLRVTLQVVSQALVRGKSAYELWKELPGNEDKSLQDYIDGVLDFHRRGDEMNAEEAARVAAEDARVLAEQGRVTAENERVTADAARTQAELERTGNEAARQNAESGRATAETSRRNAETARQNAETGRNNAEAARVVAEQARAAAEVLRESAEDARERNTSAAAAAASAAATVANEKADLANTKAGMAADAAALANEKAGLADEKAGLADQKATEAGNVNASLSGTVLTVTDRDGVSSSADLKGEQGNTVLFSYDSEREAIVISPASAVTYDSVNERLIIN